jgi:hypothetical protein
MYDEKETRRLYVRALKQYTTSNPSKEENADARKTLGLLKEGGDPIKTSVAVLCNALASYLKALKSIENFMISDPLFLGFDGSNPLLVALNKEISFTLETKGQICHDDVPKRRQIRVDW